MHGFNGALDRVPQPVPTYKLAQAMDRLCRASRAVFAINGADHDLPFDQEGFESDEHAGVVQWDVGVGAVVVDQDPDFAGGVPQGEGDAGVVRRSVADPGGRGTERVVLVDRPGPLLGEGSGQGPVAECREGTDGHRAAGADQVQQSLAGDRLEQCDSPGGADQCLAGFAEDFAGAGGKTVPDVQHGTPGRVDRGMAGIGGVGVEPGQRAEGAGGVASRGAGFAVVDPAPPPAATAASPVVGLAAGAEGSYRRGEWSYQPFAVNA